MKTIEEYLARVEIENLIYPEMVKENMTFSLEGHLRELNELDHDVAVTEIYMLLCYGLSLERALELMELIKYDRYLTRHYTSIGYPYLISLVFPQGKTIGRF